MYYDTHEMVRFRVIAEDWHDQTPSGPVGPGDEPTVSAKAPYRITGSMKDSGLGCCLWWD
jgi:DNA-directed RNA polymerase III subunit RPC8